MDACLISYALFSQQHSWVTSRYKKERTVDRARGVHSCHVCDVQAWAESQDDAHLWVNVRVDTEHEARALVVLARCGLNVLKVKLRVNVDQDAFLDGQLQLPRQLAIAVEDGPDMHRRFTMGV